MEWKMEWNGTEISVWNMEDARMEWNGRFQKWNGMEDFKREASHAKLTQGAAFKRNGTSLTRCWR